MTRILHDIMAMPLSASSSSYSITSSKKRIGSGRFKSCSGIGSVAGVNNRSDAVNGVVIAEMVPL